VGFRVALAQVCHPADEDVVALVERVAHDAAAQGADLLVFPESLMSAYEKDREAFVREAEPVGGAFSQAVEATAAANHLWVAYTMNEANPTGGLPYNTAVICDDAGTRRGAYRKVHLFESATTKESSRMSAGSSLLPPVDAPFARIGVAICYDLRFPEVTRALVTSDAGCDVMLYPAAWVDGPGKLDQWRTLLAARAIENGMFVAGVCRPDAGYVGHSCVFGPTGEKICEGGDREELIVAELDLADVRTARAAIPALAHRREDAYRLNDGPATLGMPEGGVA